MRARTDKATHFRQVEVAGDQFEIGNGINLASAATGSAPAITAVGDDANIALQLSTMTASAVQQRLLINGTPKTIVDGSATSLFDVAVASGAMSGGLCHFLIRASDGTDHQADAGMFSYSCVNKAGTVTATVTYVTGNEAKAVSAGTLTLAFTNVAGTLKSTVKLQPTGSLTETTYTIEYTVLPIRGAVTIL